MAMPLRTRQPEPPTWRGSLVSAALAVLATPGTWAIALAGFLARGGILAVLLPIVVLPTPSGIADVIGPALISFAFGVVSPAFVALVVAAIAVLGSWLLLGGLAGAWADVELILEATSDEELAPAAAGQPRHPVARALAARLLAHLPLAVALAWGAVEIVIAAYDELVTPFEVVTPLFVRVLGAVPGPIAVVVTTWALGEAAGGLAVRRVLLGGSPVARAALDGWLDLVRRPSSLATIVATDLVVGAGVVSSALSAGFAWSWVRFAVLGGESAPIAAVAVVGLVVLWLGGLVLTAALVAWRSLVWTAEAVRAIAGRAGSAGTDAERAVGTFGGGEHARTGGLSSPGSSGTL